MRRLGLMAAVCSTMVIGAGTSGSAFEGVIEWRDITVAGEGLGKLSAKGKDPREVLALGPQTILGECERLGCKVERTTIYVKDKKMRVEGDVGEERGEYMIGDLEKGTFWLVSPGKRRYVEWTRSDAKAAERKMEEMKQMLSEQLKAMNLSADQMGQIEAAMGKRKPAAKPQLRPLDRQANINGFAAQGYEVKAGDELTHGWVTQDLGELEGTVRAWTEGMRDLEQRKDAGDQVEALLLEQGLPVRVQTLRANQYDVEDLLSVKKREVDDSLFAEPAGFRKMTMGQMMQQMMGTGTPR